MDVERHFEPSAFRVREQPVRIARMTHIRAGVRVPTVRRPQSYEEPRDEWERHDSGLFHLDQVSLPTDHLACAQPDSTQFGVTVPKFRAPCVDIRKRGSKPLFNLEEHTRRIRQENKKAPARPADRLPLLDASSTRTISHSKGLVMGIRGMRGSAAPLIDSESHGRERRRADSNRRPPD